MRSLLTRAAAILAVAFGTLFAGQGVALADDHDPILANLHNVVSNTDTDNVGILNGNVVNVPVIAVLDLDDIAILGVLDEN